MVRTRTRKPAQAKAEATVRDEASEEAWKYWLMDFENELERRKQTMKESLQQNLDGLDRQLMLLLGQIPADELDLPISRTSNKDSLDSLGSLDATFSTKKPLVSSTVMKPMPPPQEPKTKVRQSRARNRLTRTNSLSDISAVYPDPSRRVTRSSSQPRDPYPRFITDYQTPMNKPGDRTVTAVTPKVDPYCPMPLKRYARQGEMAISLTGSPLMITTSITEPNISLPINNGQEVYSILPTSGPCPAIPNLDNDTRKKLQVLRENLSKILGDS